MRQLNEEELRKLRLDDNIDWRDISTFRKLSEDFIREFSDKVNWEYISKFQKLSEDFIREFKDKVDWEYISKFQELSEGFIREFSNEVDWEYISSFQNLRLYVKIVYNCGNSNRRIYRKIETPELIHIGCFIGTHQEAIDAISKKYKGSDRDEYISKVNECFNEGIS
ncbi:MAG: hypothetical protein WC136_04960 [Sphaerochaeta sp.]